MYRRKPAKETEATSYMQRCKHCAMGSVMF